MVQRPDYTGVFINNNIHVFGIYSTHFRITLSISILYIVLEIYTNM